MLKTVQTALFLLGATTEAVNVAHSSGYDISINIDTGGSDGNDYTDANLKGTDDEETKGGGYEETPEPQDKNMAEYVVDKLPDEWGHDNFRIDNVNNVLHWMND